MLVNGTDFCIPQKGQAKKGNPFGSHKYAGKSALHYELGVDIWGETWSGFKACTPPASGQTSRFLMPSLPTSLSGMREWGQWWLLWAPQHGQVPTQQHRPRREAGDAGMGVGKARDDKKSPKKLEISLPSWEVFWACAVLTQFAIEWGEPLFSIEYKD
jgi:hypothetical protein